MDILAAQWYVVLDGIWKSEIPLVFFHVVLTKTLCIGRARESRLRITRRMDLWYRGLHTGIVGGTEAEGANREGSAAIGGEEEDTQKSCSYHSTVLEGNLRQAVYWETNRE